MGSTALTRANPTAASTSPLLNLYEIRMTVSSQTVTSPTFACAGRAGSRVSYLSHMGSFSLSVLLLSALSAFAQEAKPPATPPPAPAPAITDKPAPLPPEAHVAQSMQLGGKALNYTVTVGTLPVFDATKKIGEVVFTSYTVDGPDRPVTFA